MDDYSRLNRTLPTPNLPGRIWEIHKKRKVYDRRHRKGKWSCGEAAEKEVRQSSEEQAMMNEVEPIEQETDDETHDGVTHDEKGPPRKIVLII